MGGGFLHARGLRPVQMLDIMSTNIHLGKVPGKKADPLRLVFFLQWIMEACIDMGTSRVPSTLRIPGGFIVIIDDQLATICTTHRS